MKPIIGIVGRCQNNDGYSLIGVVDQLRNAVIKCGGIPILILPTQLIEYDNIKEDTPNKLTEEEKEDLIRQIKLCDGIIIPGGTKIFEYDKFICEYTIKNDINTLGICLGMQIMYVVDTNSDLKKIKKHNDKKSKYVHEINIKDESMLRKILGQKTFVNSRHNEAIKNTNSYIISAYSKDGVIEGIEYPLNKFNVGVQRHPESVILYDIKQYDLMKNFIDTCKNKS